MDSHSPSPHTSHIDSNNSSSQPANQTSHEEKPDNIVQGSLWMIGITLVLFFLPAINGLIGGFVGGYKVATVKRALMAAILPAIVAAVGLWIILALLEAPVWGLVAGGAIAILIILSDIGLFIGAAIGGAVSVKK